MLAPGDSMGGRYRLERRIATGGMGDVWQAEDAVLGRAVAVKVLQPAMLEEPGFAERFRAEARAMATINHPGVVSVHDYGESPVSGGGSVAYLVMQYVEGESLHQVLVSAGRLAPARAMDLVAQAADALHAAHQHGIVHRDVKPGNLLVRPDGRLVLTDFGIARSALSGNLTQTGAVIGTASYLSPEQALGNRSITPASDVYSLGVVAYQCLAGRRPFEGSNPVEVAMKHLREEPAPLPADVPAGVRAVVTRAMSKDVPARWPTAAAMAGAARKAANGGAASSVEEPTTAALPAVAPTLLHDAPRYHEEPTGFRRGAAHIATVDTRRKEGTRHFGDGYRDHRDNDSFRDRGRRYHYAEDDREPPRRSRPRLILGLVVAGLAVALLLGVSPLGDMLWPAPGGQPPRGGPSGSAAGPSAAAETGIRGDAMLRPEDLDVLQPRYRVAEWQDRFAGRLSQVFGACGEQNRFEPVGEGRRQLLEHPESGTNVVQFTERYPPGEAVKYLTEVIALTDRCRETKTADGGSETLVFLDSDFADSADASILIMRTSVAGGSGFQTVSRYVFVRQGDVVTEIKLARYGGSETGQSPTDEIARAVARRAAKRLCDATPTC